MAPSIILNAYPSTVHSGEIVHVTGTWDFDGLPDRRGVKCYEDVPIHYLIYSYSPTPMPDTGTFELDWTAPNVDVETSGHFYAVLQDLGQANVSEVYAPITILPKSETPPPSMETRTVALTEGQHTIQASLNGYDTLNATINVSSTGVTCTAGPCNTTGPPGVMTSGWTVTTYLKTASVVSDVCSWIDSIGGWRNLQWTSHVLEAYYTYIGAAGHSVGFSPVTWDDVLGLYYYYINDPTAGNGKIGCGT